jgi:hypothetical protein
MIRGEPGPLGAPAASPATEVTEPVPTIHREDEPAPWRQRLRTYLHDEAATLFVAFAICSAVVAAGYVAGYRDGHADR